MLAEIAAANAAFAVIKSAIQNGKEISDVAHKIGEYVYATESLRKKGQKKKRKGHTDLEEFMHLEKLQRQEDELKQWMIYAGRPGLWQDWIKFQARVRKERLENIERKRRKVKKIIEVSTICAASILSISGIILLFLWIFYLKSL